MAACFAFPIIILINECLVNASGIGSIPNAVLSKLNSHRDLGVHSEMFSDGILPLIHCGALTNAKKHVHTGRIIGGFAFGTKALYDYMNDNPFIGSH